MAEQIGAAWSVVYFETHELEETYEHLAQAGVEFVHPIREEPWGQRVMRLYDPDGHIIEIGEPLEAVVLRLHHQGLSADSISEKTSMTEEQVKRVLDERTLHH